MPTQITAIFRVMPIGLDHHGHGVPAHVSAQPPLHLQIARTAHLVLHRNGVDIGGRRRKRHVDASLPRMIKHVLNELVSALAALGLDDR